MMVAEAREELVLEKAKAHQLEDNCKASGHTLPDDILSEIDAIFPASTNA